MSLRVHLLAVVAAATPLAATAVLKAPAEAFDGDYVRYVHGAPSSDTATFRVESRGRGRFAIKGTAIRIGAVAGDVHDAEVEGTFRSQDAQRVNVRAPGSCRFTIRLSANALDISDDTEHCGGAAVTFNGHYRKLPPSAKVVLEQGANSEASVDDHQRAALELAYPGLRVATACRGRFGPSADGVVVGLTSDPSSGPVRAEQAGVVRDGDRWVVHRLASDVGQTAGVRPNRWLPGPSGNRAYSGAIRCDPDLDRDSEIRPDAHNRPRFRLRKSGGFTPSTACFPTSDVYNNWDCFVYDASRKRFSLWYQQLHAD